MVEVTIGDEKTVTVETKDNSTEQIKQALASLVGGKFSSSPLFPDEREKRDEKNIKPFDGGEIQFDDLAASSFAVEVKDPRLGMINRYLFRQSESDNAFQGRIHRGNLDRRFYIESHNLSCKTGGIPLQSR
ncbi:MAG: hypothetical protein ACRERV_03675 [Methylococcales bacterium]